MRKIFSFLTAILFAGSMMATDVAVTIHASSGDYYAKTHEWQNATQYDQVVLDEVITANRIGTGNNGKYYSDWRFYTNGSDAGSFSIDAAEGYELQSVTFTYTVSNSGALYMGETQLTSKTPVEVSGQKAVFQCKNTNTSTNGQVRLTAIAVTYKATSGGGDTPAGDTYTVAGNPAAVFGEAWNPALAANDMVKQTDGTYKWEKTDLTLGAGTVEFKVVTNHSWDNASYPASNYQLAIAEAGQYTISITFEPANENKVSAVATKSGDAVVDPTAAVRGQFNGWDGGAMTLSAGKESASATVAIAAAGNYEFKMVINDGWRGNGYTFHRDFTSVSGLESNGDNMVLTADVAGDYIFTWTFATNTMEITFPAKTEPVDPDQMYVWNGNGVTSADKAIEKGGAAEAVQKDGTNIVVGASQKGNWCLKAGKGFTSGAYYLGIAMDNAVNAGDTLKIAYFRTSSGTSTYVMGIDFSADKASAATTYQILTKGDPQYLGSNGVPVDSIFIVPEGVANAKYIRLYRNSGSTTMWVSKVEVVKAQAGPTPPADPTVAVKGSFNEWGDEFPFTLAEDKKSASLKANIKKGDYAFKMIINGEWRSNGYEYNREFTGAAGITGNNENNMVFKADVDGDYTFTWTFANDSLGIVYPEKPIEPTAKYYLTGDSALVVDAGLAAEKAWDPMAIKSETDTFALSLKANQEYKLKLIEDGDWNGGKVYGYDALTVKADGLSADADGNIVFKLNTASAVQVVYFWEEVATDDWKMTFKLLGDFYVAPEPPVVEHTYTVAGGSDVLFGTTWAPANTDNDMVKQEDGTYKWEKTELTLPAGAIEFKVCEDHAWTTCWPAQNYSLAIAEAGIYTITITFNPAAEENKVAAVATKTGSAVVLPTIAMHGNFLGSWADTENFTVAEGNETASLTMTLAAGNYEFGMRIGGSGNWTANGIAFTRENNSAAVVAGQGNLTLAADEAGEYTFTWTFATNALNITFPKTGTGIDNTADGIKAVKVIRDGQLLIIKGEKTFTIQGQLVK